MLARAATVSCLAAVAAGAPLPAQEAAGGLAPGRWPVGFTRLARADSTRPLSSGEPRPLDIAVWYPARAPGARHLTFRAYFPPPVTGQSAVFAAFLVAQGAADSLVATWLDAPMHATRDPTPAGDRFPLVLLAQGNGQAARDQAPLAKYLASHGYVLATSPSPMRISGPLADEASVGARAEEQALDLAFVGAALAGRADVAPGRMGLVAHSFGARGALLHERLDAFMAPDFGLLRSLTAAERWAVEVPGLHHHHFTNLGAAAMDQPALRPALGATPATARGYAAVAGATLAFLDAFVKQDATARRRFESGTTWPGLGRIERVR